MRFNFLLFFYLVTHSFLLAQDKETIFDSYPTDEKIRIYYDLNYNIVDKESAKIYRELILKDNNTPLSKISEYNNDGTKIKTFYSSYIGYPNGRDSIILDGPRTFFYKNGYYSLIQYFKNNIQTAEEIKFYEDGKIYIESNYLLGKKNGQEKEYYKNGNIKSIRNYFFGKIDGKEVGYYENGTKSYEINYSNDIPIGKGIGYYGTGEILYERNYMNSNYSEIGYSINGCKLYVKEPMGDPKDFKMIYYQPTIFGKCSEKILSEFNYKNNLIHGIYKVYHSTGSIKYSVNYKYGLKEGEFKSFYDNESLKTIVKYENDLKNGVEKGYHKNKAKKYTKNYKQDLLNGTEKHYDKSGNEVSSKSWINNSIIGESKVFYADGKTKSLTNYSDDGLKNGNYFEYYPSGNILLSGEYIKGLKQSEILYYFDSIKPIVKRKTNLKDNVKNGEEIVYYNNGQVKYESNFQNGKLKGEYAEYSELNNEMIYSVNYIDNKKHGEEIEYFSSCLPSKITNYSDGIINGDVIEYYESGGVKSEAKFENGIQSGKTIQYYETGEKYSEVNYENFKRVNTEVGFYKSGIVSYKKEYISKEAGKEFNTIQEAKINEEGYYETGEKKYIKNIDNIYLSSSYESYYKSGKIESVFEYDKLNPISEIVYYDTSVDSLMKGPKKYERKYVNDLIQGEEIGYYETGEKKSTVVYEKGLKQGNEIFFYRGGDENYSVLWENGLKKEKRIALVIGNAAYDEEPLLNPVNDATLIKNSLEKLGFDVDFHTDLETKREMTEAIFNFGEKRKNYDVAFIYYAGHGVQVNNQNYFLPIKEKFNSESAVKAFGVSMQQIIDVLAAQRENQLNLVVLDACRNNPFEKKFKRSRNAFSKGAGLAKPPELEGALFAYSTRAGDVAPDGDGNNSLYTEVLASKMLEENVEIKQVFQNVRSEVMKISEGNQRPIEESLLMGEGGYYLNQTIQ